jgi:hypothetical protein
LNNWFYQHIDDPYPTDEEKNILASKCLLSINQINNWFGNKRIRVKRKKQKLLAQSQGQNPDNNKDISNDEGNIGQDSPSISGGGGSTSVGGAGALDEYDDNDEHVPEIGTNGNNQQPQLQLQTQTQTQTQTHQPQPHATEASLDPMSSTKVIDIPPPTESPLFSALPQSHPPPQTLPPPL